MASKGARSEGKGSGGQSPSIGCHESSWTAAAVSNLPAGQLQKALKSCQHLPRLTSHPPSPFPHCPSVAKPCPFSQSPLDFCHFSTLSRPFSCSLCSNYCLCFSTVFAFTLPLLSLRFLRFFWQRKMLNTIFAVDLRFSTFFVYFGPHLLLLLLLFFLSEKGSVPSFNFTCHGCICSFFLCIAVQFNEQFFMNFQLGAPICLWFHLRNSQMRLQLSVECAKHSVGRVCCVIFGMLESLSKSVNEWNLIIVTNGLVTVFQRIQQVIEQKFNIWLDVNHGKMWIGFGFVWKR